VVLTLAQARALFLARRVEQRAQCNALAFDNGLRVEHTSTESRIYYPYGVGVYVYYRPDWDKSVTIVG